MSNKPKEMKGKRKYICEEHGENNSHSSSDCYVIKMRKKLASDEMTNDSPKKETRPRVCYNCNKEGHMSNKCPEKKKIKFIDLRSSEEERMKMMCPH